MKKIIALLLALVMVFALCACGKTDSVSGDKTVVGLVVAGAFGDRSFYDSSKEGVDKLASEFSNVEVKTIECNNENHDAQMRNAADVSNIVVCVGWEFYNIETIAPEYPNVHWIWIDNATSAPVENVLNITYAQNEGSFLAGYIAAAMSDSGVVGAVGGEDSDTINDFIVGYEAGAKLANENVEVQVQYAGTYDDPAKGKELALALYDAGCDVVFQVASLTGEGVFEAAKERNLLAIGVDSDQKYIDPEHIACSMIKKVGESIETAINDLIDNGSWQGGQIWVADMSTGLVDVGYGDDTMTQQVSDELKAEVESIKQQIIGGEIEVPTAFN